MPLKLVAVIGARPQFIKAAVVSRQISKYNQSVSASDLISEFIIHTGQHYDANMSDIFFEQMGIPRPDKYLGIHQLTHGAMTGRMMEEIEKVLLAKKPDWLLVYGDTNSTLAGALAAVKLHIPVAHVEAGLRSFNREMPEEHNRVLTDHCADMLFCPTQTAVDNLKQEGLVEGVHWVGDTMFDAILQFAGIAARRSTILADLALQPKEYLLATVHRPYNTDVPENLRNILSAFVESGERVIFPVHPRTCNRMKGLDIPGLERSGVRLIEPVGYLDMLLLEKNARIILTDSGGIQKEAFFFAVPCLTLRPETEWVETVQAGWNRVVGADKALILEGIHSFTEPSEAPPQVFGSGQSAAQIVAKLVRHHGYL